MAVGHERKTARRKAKPDVRARRCDVGRIEIEAEGVTIRVDRGPDVAMIAPSAETLKAMLLAERHESERLRQIIKELQRYRFGWKAETLPEEQPLLGLEDVQQAAACTEAKSVPTTSQKPQDSRAS